MNVKELSLNTDKKCTKYFSDYGGSKARGKMQRGGKQRQQTENAYYTVTTWFTNTV
jgi:hypothetical protein